MNASKAKGPDGRIKKNMCITTVPYLFSYTQPILIIFLDSQHLESIKKIIIIPKKERVTTINDLRLVALTPIVMKCFERIILKHLKKEISPVLDPLQFVYQPKRTVEDALIVFSNYVYSHLHKAYTYCRILFIDFSSAFNTIEPHLFVKNTKCFKC